MKKIIKSLTVASVLLLSINANAQFKLGVQGGVNITSPTVSGLTKAENVSKPFFGIIAQIDLGGLYFRPSLNYLQNQANTVTTATIPAGSLPGSIAQLQTTTITRSVKNVEIPLDLVLPIKLKSGNKFLISIAPTVTVGFKGNQNRSVSTTAAITGGSATTTTTSSNLTFGNNNNPLEIKGVDWGSRFGLGYAFKGGLQLNAAYKLGFTDTDNNPNTTTKTNNVIVTLAYFLFKK